MTDEMKSNEILYELQLLIQYSVQEAERDKAVELAEKYQTSLLILRVFKEYYSTLPEAREEPILKISELMHRQGVYLFVLTTTNYSYLYAASADEVVLLSEYLMEVNQDILSFFGYVSQSEFTKNCPPVDELEECDIGELVEVSQCPACGVEEGELHLLGCIVEVCPWCDGQLCNCNCRFEKLETEEIESEEQVEAFYELLIDKGRIPFSKSQSPAYPGTSEGFDTNQ